MVRCPVCGRQQDMKYIGKEYDLRMSTCDFNGNRKITWSVKYSGYTALKRMLIPILEKIIFKLDKLNGCDMWPDCLSCLIELEDCPNETARVLQKSRKASHEAEAKALQAQGLSTNEIAVAMGKSREQVRRYKRG